jgi:hypothetical protein
VKTAARIDVRNMDSPLLCDQPPEPFGALNMLKDAAEVTVFRRYLRDMA